MKKMLFFLFITGAMNGYTQTKSLVAVIMVTPKLGQAPAFATAWKTHLDKYHHTDTTNRRNVYEIISGPHTGSYYLTSANLAWADYDIDRPTEKAHDLDYATTITSTLATQGGELIFRWADTLSYRPDVPATKFLLTTYHIKAGKQTELTDEIKRSIAVNKKINSPISYDGFIQSMSGSTPTVVIIRHLKDGFKELDPDYNKAPTDQFKNAYIEMFGNATWQKRIDMLPAITDLVEVEMMKLRPDLSSKR